MEEVNVLLISSKESGSRSGKNTFANIFEQYCIENVADTIVKIYEFSYPIKKIVHDVFGIPFDILYSDKKEIPCGIPISTITDNATPRQLMQYIGTELFRNNFGYNIWVDVACRKINEFKQEIEKVNKKGYFLICDWRFDNEFELNNIPVNKILIDINRHNNPYKKTNHISDNALTIPLQKYKYILANDSSLDDFEKRCYLLSKEIIANE